MVNMIGYNDWVHEEPKMSKTKEEVVSDIESLTKYFKGVLQDPKHSNKAGQIHDLFKKLNKALH